MLLTRTIQPRSYLYIFWKMVYKTQRAFIPTSVLKIWRINSNIFLFSKKVTSTLFDMSQKSEWTSKYSILKADILKYHS